MEDLQQPTGVAPEATPTPTQVVQPVVVKKQDNSKGILGTILAIVGFFILGLPLGIAALILGIVDEPKTTWSWASIVIGALDIVAVLVYLSN
jgi:hypothetical protein